MARKRQSDSEGGINLDSLMDALTNVVAVLILVLVLVQADVSQKVQKFLDDLLPATPEEVAESQERVEDLRVKSERLEARLKEEAPTPAQIEEEKRQLALLEESLKENRDLLADLNALRELEKEVRAERDSEKERTVTVQEEIAKLEALLDETPAIQPDAPTVVNIPNSRPIPDDAKVYYAMALKNRIHIIDQHTPLELFEKEFDRHKKDWLIERIRKRGASDRYIYDGQKIVAHFKDFNWQNTRKQKIEIRANPTSTRPQLLIIPDQAEGGTAIEDLATPGSGFSTAIKVLRQNFKSVLFFRVHPDSFNAYLEARNLVDKANVPAGWEVSYNTAYYMTLSEIEIKRLEEPPPPPATPPGPKPPPIKPKLD